jgi:protein-L-isoaspartate(D-aspartate) O-methyltransferase
MNIQQQQAELRQKLERSGITDQRVLDCIQQTRRDLFVPSDLHEAAYEDRALPIDCEQTISQPYMVALMTQELGLLGHERVLEVGTGSGYQAAVLARLCRQVVTIERIAELSEHAQRVLAELGFDNIVFRVGDGTLGCREFAPYDGILVTAGAPDVPSPLYNQLKVGGRLVIPVGDNQGQVLQVIEKHESGPVVREAGGCRFVKLIGDAGWQYFD